MSRQTLGFTYHVTSGAILGLAAGLATEDFVIGGLTAAGILLLLQSVIYIVEIFG